MAAWIVGFGEEACTDIRVAGGKGANLARMTAAGLPVPPGFCVTTDAYEEFVQGAGIGELLLDTIARAREDADTVEAATANLRAQIVAAPLPDAIAGAISQAYAAIGSDSHVAVRSSGTAEDLADASFAGLHDTYLDIRGVEQVLDAVRRCWASMWTARATSYRAVKGFDQAAARISVVIQQMVSSEVSGVMFTANPLTAATDEIVVNATWGLGEALVSGIATPDEHILALGDLRVKQERVGAKEKQVTRDPDTGSGTVTVASAEALRGRFALAPVQLRALGELGKRVMAYYDEIPQDIEWALADGTLYLLQSRPATGADFAWEEDLEYWRAHDDDDGSVLWSRSWADEVWNGAVSPLTYTVRGPMFTDSLSNNMALWGLSPLTEPMYRYHGGTAYYNTAVEERLVLQTAPAPFRVGLLAHVAPDRHEQILAAKLSPLTWLNMHRRIVLRGKPIHGPLQYFKTVDDYMQNRVPEADGLSPHELSGLSDEELISYTERIVALKTKNTSDQWTEFFIIVRDAFSLLAGVLAVWYDPDPKLVITDLMSGTPVRTQTAEENLWLWRLSQRIRGSEELSTLFEQHEVEYLSAFETCADGRAFLEDYGRFMAAHGQGGHSDRDIYYPRRADDPGIDYRTFRTLLSAENPLAPEDRERAVDARRDAVIAQVEARLRSQRFGAIRARIFRLLLNYVHRFFLYRDNQRHYFDRYTYAMKRAALEFGHRLVARDVLSDVEDPYFLGRPELYGLLRSGVASPKLKAKIAGRRTNFFRQLNHQARNPKYMRGHHPVSFDTGDGAGGLTGVGTSRGQVTGRARVILHLKDIGQVNDGEILVTVSTDPGWTPVFTLLSGIVLETGGMLAHGSLLAREYGFPAVQIADATQLIPDGATITVDGDTGEVVIESEPEPVDAEAAVV